MLVARRVARHLRAGASAAALIDRGLARWRCISRVARLCGGGGVEIRGSSISGGNGSAAENGGAWHRCGQRGRRLSGANIASWRRCGGYIVTTSAPTGGAHAVAAPRRLARRGYASKSWRLAAVRLRGCGNRGGGAVASLAAYRETATAQRLGAALSQAAAAARTAVNGANGGVKKRHIAA